MSQTKVDEAVLRSVDELSAELARLKVSLERIESFVAALRPLPPYAELPTPAHSPVMEADLPLLPDPEPMEVERVSEEEVRAFTHLTSASTVIIEHILAMAIFSLSEADVIDQYTRLFRSGAAAKTLDHHRPIAIMGGRYTKCANPVDLDKASLDDLLGIPIKPNEQKINGIDTIVLKAVESNTIAVFFSQVKLGGSSLSIGSPTSDHSRAIAAMMPYMVEKSNLVLAELRRRWPNARFKPQYILITTRALPKKTSAWFEETDYTYFDREAVVGTLPDRFRRWIYEPYRGPPGFEPPAWLRVN